MRAIQSPAAVNLPAFQPPGFLYPPRLAEGAQAGVDDAAEAHFIAAKRRHSSLLLFGVANGFCSEFEIARALRSDRVGAELISLSDRVLSAFAALLNHEYQRYAHTDKSDLFYDLVCVGDQAAYGVEGGETHLVVVNNGGLTFFDVTILDQPMMLAEAIYLAFSLLQFSGVSMMTAEDARSFMYWFETRIEDYEQLQMAGVDTSKPSKVWGFLMETETVLESFEVSGVSSIEDVEAWLEETTAMINRPALFEVTKGLDGAEQFLRGLRHRIISLRGVSADPRWLAWLRDVYGVARRRLHHPRCDTYRCSGDFEERSLGEAVFVSFGEASDEFVAQEAHEWIMNGGEDVTQRYSLTGCDDAAFLAIRDELVIEAQGAGLLVRASGIVLERE